jgi:hypothetical protein
MAHFEEPPFARGDTYFGTGTPTANDGDQICGRKYEFPDTVNGTNYKVVCMAVRNTSGSAITVARACGEFDTGVNSIDREISQFPANTAGAYCWPLDDAYVVGTTIADDDIFYVVVEGPCVVKTSATGTSEAADVTQGVGVVINGSGLVDGSPATTQHVFGLATATSSTTSTNVLILVGNRRNSY